MSLSRLSRTLTWVCVLMPVTASLGDVRLPALIGNNMVLQRDIEARIWGWADSNETVRVKGSWQQEWTPARVNESGAWAVALETPEVGGPYQIAVEGNNTLTLENVLVGEVWICSGQSNMEMGLNKNRWSKGIQNYDKEIAAANLPNIRLFTVKRTVATEPQANCDGAWAPCTPETVADFSATAFFFGKALNQKLNIPIGLIHSSWGGTRAEAWTSRETLDTLRIYEDELAQQYLPPTPENSEKYARAQESRSAKGYQLDANNVGYAKGYADPEFDDGSWESMTLPTAWEISDGGLKIDGVVWFRHQVLAPKTWTGKNLRLNLGPVDDCDTTYFNGVRLGSIAYGTPGGWTVPRTYTIPAAIVRPGNKNVITVRVYDGGGNGGIYGSSEQLSLVPADDPESEPLTLAGSWKYKVESILEPNPVHLAQANSPSVLYNGMIAPLTPYRIRGAIWYQGESNHTKGLEYRTLFPAMIANWRQAWGQGDFPFYYVQIAPFMYREPESSTYLREAQLMTLAVPNTGMAVLTDISEVDDIHPRNKQDVGIRLALWALAKTYGYNEIVYSGPIYKSMKVEGEKIRIFFDHVGEGLMHSGYTPREFTIAGKDRVFVPAQAQIEGDTLVVFSPLVPEPVAVRFGWSNTPTPNLYNSEDLPASPFRTDDWTDTPEE